MPEDDEDDTLSLRGKYIHLPYPDTCPSDSIEVPPTLGESSVMSGLMQRERVGGVSSPEIEIKMNQAQARPFPKYSWNYINSTEITNQLCSNTFSWRLWWGNAGYFRLSSGACCCLPNLLICVWSTPGHICVNQSQQDGHWGIAGGSMLPMCNLRALCIKHMDANSSKKHCDML